MNKRLFTFLSLFLSFTLVGIFFTKPTNASENFTTSITNSQPYNKTGNSDSLKNICARGMLWYNTNTGIVPVLYANVSGKNYVIFNDSEDLINTSKTVDLTISRVFRGCTASKKGDLSSISFNNPSTTGGLDNIFLGYKSLPSGAWDDTNTLVTPSELYSGYYSQDYWWDSPIRACASNSGGNDTKSSIRSGGGDGCHAYYIRGTSSNHHSISSGSGEKSFTLKLYTNYFIGEDKHGLGSRASDSKWARSISSKCDDDWRLSGVDKNNASCRKRSLNIYACSTDTKKYNNKYEWRDYSCFTSDQTFYIIILHSKYSATSSASPTSSQITSNPVNVTFTHKIKRDDTNTSYSNTAQYNIYKTVKKNGSVISEGYIYNDWKTTTSDADETDTVTIQPSEVPDGGNIQICERTDVRWLWQDFVPKKNDKSDGAEGSHSTGAKVVASDGTLIRTNDKTGSGSSTRTTQSSISCSTISKAATPTGGANFETESNNADGKSWDDGKEHTETITIDHLIKRTDSNANPASVKTKYIVYESKNGRNGTYTQLSPKKNSADSQSFTQSSKSQSLSVKSSDIKVSAGQTIEYCQKIVVISSADVNGNLGSSWTSGTIGCANLSVGTPAEETVNFTPSVSGTSLDANLTPGGSDGDTLKFVGDGETTTYSVTFSASIKRENNSSSKVTSASANYNTYCLKSKKLEKCNSSVSLKNDEAKYIGGWNNGTFNVSVPVGKTVKQCLSLTASTSVKYKIYSSGQIDEIAGSRTEDTVTDCVEISNPIPRQTITFGGSSTATNLDSVSYWAEQNMWVGEFNEYYPNLKHTISRTSAESSLKRGIKDAPIRYKISATLNGTAQSSVNITSSSTLNYNNTKTVRDTLAKVPVTRGYSSNYCEKLEHDSEVYWEGGKFEQRSPGYDESHEACIKYGTPAYSEESESEYKYFSITGTVSAPNNTDEAIKVDDYYLLKANKTSLTFPHKLERSDNGTEGSTANGTYNVQHKIGASGNFTNIITNSAFRLTSGPNNQDNYYKNFNATSTNISPSGLGTENAKQVCQKNTFVSKNYTVTITNTFDVGKIDGIEYSRRQKSSTIGDTADGDGTTGESNTVCVNVVRPYNFHIIREGTNSDAYLHRTNPENVVYSGQTYAVKYQATIKKEKDEYSLTGIPNANIRLLAFVFDADAPDITEAEIFPSLIDGVKESNSPSPETYYTNILDTNGYDGKYQIIPVNGDDGEDKAIENGGIVPGDGRPYTYTYSYESTIKDLSPGQKYCTALAISPADSGITGLNSNSFTYGWVVSNLSCSNVAKKPTMQVHGGSVYARKINTSKSSLPTSDGNERNYFGSWGDFALISTGDPKNSGILAGNAGMASGAALANGKKNASTICTHSPLTITNEQCKNSGDNNSLGGANVSIANSPEDFYNAFKQLFIGKDSTLDGSSGDVRIDENDGGQFTFDDGKTIIYYSDTNKTITIKNNLEVDDDYGSISELPQIIILSGGNVNIDESVERVDAWIIAKGTVNTCSGFDPAGDKKPSSDDCDSQLVINGPVISNSLILPRTAGADPSEGEKDMSTPAELIDYLPSSLLWAYNQAKNGNTPQTVYLKELAPRR